MCFFSFQSFFLLFNQLVLWPPLFCIYKVYNFTYFFFGAFHMVVVLGRRYKINNKSEIQTHKKWGSVCRTWCGWIFFLLQANLFSSSTKPLNLLTLKRTEKCTKINRHCSKANSALTNSCHMYICVLARFSVFFLFSKEILVTLFCGVLATLVSRTESRADRHI